MCVCEYRQDKEKQKSSQVTYRLYYTHITVLSGNDWKEIRVKQTATRECMAAEWISRNENWLLRNHQDRKITNLSQRALQSVPQRTLSLLRPSIQKKQNKTGTNGKKKKDLSYRMDRQTIDVVNTE